MMKRIVSPALFALALAMPGLAAGEAVKHEPVGPDERVSVIYKRKDGNYGLITP